MGSSFKWQQLSQNRFHFIFTPTNMDLTLFPKLFNGLSYSAGNNRNSIRPPTHPSSHYPSFHRVKLWLHPWCKQSQFLQLLILMPKCESDASAALLYCVHQEEPGAEPQAGAEENRKPSKRKKLSWRCEVCLSATFARLLFSSVCQCEPQ